MGAGPSKAAPPPAPTPPPPQASSSSSSLWPELPTELADLVLCRTSSLADRACFGSVCRHWRRAAQQSSPSPLPPLPWLHLGDGIFQCLPNGDVHRLRFTSLTPCRCHLPRTDDNDNLQPRSTPRRRCRCLRSSVHWLLLLREPCCGGEQRRHFLENPLTGAIVPLPGNHHPSTVNAELNVWKLIVCSGDLIVAMVSYKHGDDFVPVLACYRPGMSSWSLSPPCPGTRRYRDIAFYHGKIYAVTGDGCLFAHEVTEDTTTGEPTIASATEVIEDGRRTCIPRCAEKRYLVISCDKLLMVRWSTPYDHNIFLGDPVEEVSKTMTFKVFEADLAMSRWSKAGSLDDQVLFVAENCSKAVSASSHGDYLRGNRIYFVDYGLEKCRIESTIIDDYRSCGMFDLSDDTVHPIDVFRISDKSRAEWFFPFLYN